MESAACLPRSGFVQQDFLNEVLIFSMADHIYKRLRTLKLGNSEYHYDKSEHFKHDLQFLQDHGFIGLKPFISELEKDEVLIGKIKLTPCGHKFVEFREKYEKKYSSLKTDTPTLRAE